MKGFIIKALGIAAILALFILKCSPAQAADVSLLDPIRLSVGAVGLRTFEQGVVANDYTSEWRVGLPLAWEITSPNDPAVKFPISLIGSVGMAIPNKGVRATLGISILLKKAGTR